MYPGYVSMKKTLPLICLSSTLLLTACGWQLRGADNPNRASSESTLEEQTKTQKSTTPAASASSQQPTPTASNQTQKTTGGVRLVMKNRNHGLTTALNRVAWENKIEFSDSGRTWLVIGKEKLEKRPLTVTETGVAAQYQLILTITFSQQRADGTLITPPQQIVSWRSYDFDAQLIVAKAQEEESLIVEMREELARRMLSLLQ